jgi:hypothetical protein
VEAKYADWRVLINNIPIFFFIRNNAVVIRVPLKVHLGGCILSWHKLLEYFNIQGPRV